MSRNPNRWRLLGPPLIVGSLIGCAAAPLEQPAAVNVIVTRNAPADDCIYVGEVLGSQGNFWTAEFTSDEDLIVGARNRMRDEAYAIGANFVQIELENQSHNTADLSAGGVFSSVIIGNGYDCPSYRVHRGERQLR